MLEGAGSAKFEPAERRHRRDDFLAISAGITHGSGSPVCTNVNDGGHTGVVQEAAHQPRHYPPRYFRKR